MTRRLKIDVIADISELIGIEAPHLSTGSTEPRELFDSINLELGLGLSPTLTKPEMAKGIVESAGHNWLGSHESTGGTVTLDGLEAVLSAVGLLTAN